MPQLVAGAAIAGGVSAIFTAGSFTTVFATTIAAGFLGQVLSPLPSNLHNGAPQSRQVSGRSTLASRRYVLGRAQIAPVNLCYGEITGDQGEYLHLVLPFCQGPLTSIDLILFDQEPVGERDGDGVVIEGTFERQPDGAGGWAEIARIHESLGSDSKTADADLVAESDGRWTADHRGRGIADLVMRLRRDALDRLYPSGAPTVRIVARGVAAYDPRDAATRWTVNPALLVRWLLTLPRPDGFGVDGSELDDTLVAAAANLCDERVAVDTYSSPLWTADPVTDTLTFASREVMIGLGDGVRVVGPGPLPTGLSAGVTYYAIRPDGMTCKLATTYANALAGVAIDIISAGSGDMTLSHMDQARYQCSGVYEADQSPRQLLSALLASMAGVLWYAEGKFHLRAGAWLTPRSAPITERDLAGSLQIQTSTPWRDQFNTVRGTYTDPLQDFQPTDFKAVTDAAYVTEDGAELPKDIDFQWVDNPLRAQRLAQINLRRARSGQILTLQCKFTVLDVGLWDTVKVSIAKLDLSEDTFRVIGWDMQQGQLTTLTLILQAETSAVFGWSATDGDIVEPRPELVLPDPRVVDPPASITLASGTTHLLRMLDGTILSRIYVQWAASPDANVGAYEVQWKHADETAWTNALSVPASQLSAHTGAVMDGEDYDVRVRAVRLGNAAKSDWVEDTETVIGKTATPTGPSALTTVTIAGGVQLTWPDSPDADYWRTRIYEATANDWTHGSRTLIDTITGNGYARLGLSPGDVRYYWIVHEDTSGLTSDRWPTTGSGNAGVAGTAGGASVGTAAVDTINIVGNAVTNITSAYTGSTTVISAGVWTQVQSLAVTLGAYPAVIRASCHANTNAGVGNFGSTQIRVLRNGSVIAGPVANTAYTMADGFLGFDIVDSPGAGTHTYSIELFPSHGCGVDARYLHALETKR